jgi:hypothetical protein
MCRNEGKKENAPADIYGATPAGGDAEASQEGNDPAEE